MTRRPPVPTWVPVALAVALGVGLYILWIRPQQTRIDAATQQLREAQQQAGALEAQIARDQAVPAVPLPITKAAFDHLWPDVVKRAQADGYTLQGVTFTPAPPLSPAGRTEASAPDTPSQPVTPLEISARFTGQYLPLEETLTRMQTVLPLWSWRSIVVAPQQGGSGVSITVDGVVPVRGRLNGPRGPAGRRRGPVPPPAPPTSQP